MDRYVQNPPSTVCYVAHFMVMENNYFLEAQNLWSSQHTRTNQTLFVSLPNLWEHEGRLLTLCSWHLCHEKTVRFTKENTPISIICWGLDLQKYQLGAGGDTQYPNQQYKLGVVLQLRKMASFHHSRYKQNKTYIIYIHDSFEF